MSASPHSEQVAAARLAATVPRHRSRGFQALGHAFSVETDDPVLGAYLDDIFKGFPDAGPEDGGGQVMRYTLRVPASRDSTRRLYADGEQLTTSDREWHLLGYLMWHINRQAVARSAHLVRLHAAAAVWRGAGVVLPAEMEAGKTTLVAGLVQAGFGYLSDEIAAFAPSDGGLVAYPKPLSVDPGSWQVLGDLRPDVAEALRPYLVRQWQVPASAIRPDAVVGSAPPRVFIAPRYEAGARTRLEPVGRADLLKLVLGQTFEFRKNPARDMRLLGGVIGRSDCYRLTVGDLPSAVSAVTEVVEEVAA